MDYSGFSKILISLVFLCASTIFNDVHGQGVCRKIEVQPNRIRLLLSLTKTDNPTKYRSYETCWQFNVKDVPADSYVQLNGRGDEFCRVRLTVQVDGEKVKTTDSVADMEVMKFAGRKVDAFLEVFGCTCRSNIICKLSLGYSIHESSNCEDKVIEINNNTKYAVSNSDVDIRNKKCKFIFKGPESFKFVLSAVKIQNEGSFKGSLISHLHHSDDSDGSAVEVTENAGLFFDFVSSAILSVEMLNVVMEDSTADLIEVQVQLQQKKLLDCHFLNTACSWNGNFSLFKNDTAEMRSSRDQNAEVESPEIETRKEGMCFSIAYSSEKSVFDAFYVIWESEHTSEMLYKEFGREQTEVTEKLDLPKQDSGKIRLLLSKVAGKEEDARVRLKTVSTASGACYPKVFKQLNCNFFGTLCNWVGRPKGIRRYTFHPSDHRPRFNERSTSIVSPEIKKGDYCFVLDFSGRGRLSILKQEGAKSSVMTSFLVKNSTATKKIKISSDDVDEKFKIIIKFSGLKTSDEKPDLYMRRTALGPVTDCPRILSHESVWKIPGKETAFMELSHKLGVRSVNKVATSFAFESAPVWFCFRYNFTASNSLNDICLEVGTEEKDEQLLWKRCGGGDSGQQQHCIQIREAKSTTIYLKTFNHPERTISPDKIIDPDRVANFSVLVSSPWLQAHWDCDVSSICGWYQSTFNFVEFYGQFSFRALKFPDSQNESNVDFIHSPTIASTSSLSCVSFRIGAKVLTILNVKVVNALGENSVLLRTFFPRYGEQINQTIISNGRQFRLAIGIGQYSLGMGRDVSGSNMIEGLNVKDGPCSESSSSVDCDFESGNCGWIENRWSRVQNITSFYKGSGSDLLPPFDCTYQQTGKYGKIYSVTDTGISETFSLTSPQFRGTEIARDVCVSFCYYMNGNRDDETTLNLVFDAEDKRTIWSKMGDQDISWYKVQFPVTTSEEFRLSFGVNSTGKNSERYGIAIDNVIVKEEQCDGFEETVDQPY